MNIERDIYLTKRRRVEPISVVYGSTVSVALTVKDYDLTGYSAKAYSRSDKTGETYESANTPTISADTITFTPDEGFFQPGHDVLQLELTKGTEKPITFLLDVICDPELSVGEITNPTVIKTVAERAEAAATAAQQAIRQIPPSYLDLADDVDQLSEYVQQLEQQGYPMASIDAAVNAWGMAHMDDIVPDGSITPRKLDSVLKSYIQGKTVSPVYLGDYITDLLPSACIRYGNRTYLFDGLGTSGTFTDAKSTVRIYDNATNALIDVKSIDLGHANSAAFDGTHFWIAPTWDYEAGSATLAKATYLYRYNGDFTVNEKVTVPTDQGMQGVSYNWVDSTLYAFGYDHKIYKWNGTEFASNTEAITLANPEASYNQDFAVYGDIFLISDPAGMVLVGSIEQNRIVSHFTIANIDQDARFRTGELEGMEFDAGGVLYATKYSTIFSGNSTLYNGFFTAIPVFNAYPRKTAGISYSEANYSATWKQGNGSLYISEASIRDLNQLRCMLQKPNNINIEVYENANPNIDKHYEAKDITLTDDITIVLNTVPLVCNTFRVQGCHLMINCIGTGELLDIKENKLRLERAAILTIGGNQQLHTASKIDIQIANFLPLVKIRTIPATMTLAGNDIKNAGVYSGSTRVTPPTVQVGEKDVECPAGKSQELFEVEFGTEFAHSPNIFLSMFTASTGYEDMSTFSYWVKQRSVSGFTFVVAHNTAAKRAPKFCWYAIDRQTLL